jgi:predicted MPP superfamily phosphohydrolase
MVLLKLALIVISYITICGYSKSLKYKSIQYWVSYNNQIKANFEMVAFLKIHYYVTYHKVLKTHHYVTYYKLEEKVNVS